MKRTTVQKAYLTEGSSTTRVLAMSGGQLFIPGEGWVFLREGASVVSVGKPYDRWCDVPAAWLGAIPWWR